MTKAEQSNMFGSKLPVSLALAFTVRFLLELALLTGVAVVVWNLVPGWWAWLAATAAVIAVAVVWGLFLSPKAEIRLEPLVAFGLEALLFLGTGAGLFAIHLGIPAAIGIAVWLLDRVALWRLKR